MTKIYAFSDNKISKKAVEKTYWNLRQFFSDHYGDQVFVYNYDISSKIITYNEVYLRLHYYPSANNARASLVQRNEPLETVVALFNAQNEAMREKIDPFIPIGPLQNIICEYAEQPRIEIVD